MKKLLMLAVVAGFAATVIGCGPAPTSKPAGGGSTEKKTEESKK